LLPPPLLLLLLLLLQMSMLEASNSRLSAALAAAGCEARSLKHMNHALERVSVCKHGAYMYTLLASNFAHQQ
jgi:hypothetical protein